MSGETSVEAAAQGDTPVSLARQDLLALWKVLEKLVVSIDLIGGAYEYSSEDESGRVQIDSEERALHDRALADYLEELGPELAEARNVLIEQLKLGGDEAKHLTRNVIQYWSAGRSRIDYDGEELDEPDIALE